MSAATVTLGNEITLTTTITIGDVPADDLGLSLEVLRPDGSTDTFAATAMTHPVVGTYSYDYLPAATGVYTYKWQGDPDAQGAAAGTFEVSSIFDGAVSDIRDLRVLIPACRRAIDGPLATAPDAPAATLDDRAVLALIADATAELILYTQGNDAFGYQLLATARDPFYMAPVAWATDRQRVPAADAAILSQAALDHYYYAIKLMKVTEGMKNEAVEWSYSLSATVIASWVQYLIANRDKAIAALQVMNAPMDAYISLVAERDMMAAVWLESYVPEVGAPVPYAGGGGSGPLIFDWRFGSFG
jgi:hypothetical protein